MNLCSETIFDFYTLKNKKVLCQIKINPESQKFKNTCRFLSQEQWMVFDKELEKLLTTKDRMNGGKCSKFNIKPYIEVKVQKSKLSFKNFGKVLDAVDHSGKGDVGDIIEQNLVLECLINFHIVLPLSSSLEPQEYEPQIDTSVDGKLCSQLQYEPYTPSKKTSGEIETNIIKNGAADFQEYNEDAYCPKPVSDIDAIEPHLTQAVPKYVPAPINACLSSKERRKINFHSDVIIGADSELNYVDENKSLKTKLSKKTESIEYEYIPKSQDVTITNVPIYIPTPIQEAICVNVLKTNNMRKNKARSNTIDRFPQLLKEMETKKIKQLPRVEKQTQCQNKNLKKRSMTIDEFPDSLANVTSYIPSSKKEATYREVFKKCDFLRNKKRSASIDAFPMALEEKNKDGHISEKEEITIDTIPVAHSELNKLQKSKEKLLNLNDQLPKIQEKQFLPEKNSEEILKISSSIEGKFTNSLNKKLKRASKTQIVEREIGNTINRNIKRQKLIEEKALRNDRKTKNSGSEETKCIGRSEWPPSISKKLAEEHSNLTDKSKYKKHKHKNKDLFGTDDDDDDDERSSENSNGSKFYNDRTNSISCKALASEKLPCCSSSSTSRKRKHKIDKISESQQQTHDMSKSLPYKKLALLNEEDTKSSKSTKNSSSFKVSSLKTAIKPRSEKAHVENRSKLVSQAPTNLRSLTMEERSKRKR